MSSLKHFTCPYCHNRIEYEVIEEAYPMKMMCSHCYRPVVRHRRNQSVKRRKETISKTAFLIHSSKGEDKHVITWVRNTLGLYGVSTRVVEEDSRSLDFLQKSKDAIEQAEFVVVVLTKRYQYKDDSGEMRWKGSDKCYDEIAMSYMRGRDIYAFVEEDVDPGKVLERVSWYGVFKKIGRRVTIEHAQELFQTLELNVGNIGLRAVTYKA